MIALASYTPTLLKWHNDINIPISSYEPTDSPSAFVLLHELDVQTADHLTTEGLYWFNGVGSLHFGSGGHQRAQLPRVITTVEWTLLWGMLGDVFERRVYAYLWAVCFAAGLRDQEIVVNYVSKLLLQVVLLGLLVLGEAEHADSRRYLSPAGLVKHVGIDLHLFRLFFSWWKIDFFRFLEVREAMHLMG